MKAQRVTIHTLRQMKERGEKIAVLTAYDATFARLFDDAGADVLLVGDSLGMVIQGHDTTLPVTLDEIIYHTRAVMRGVKRAHVIGDMPFGSYQASLEDGVANGRRASAMAWADFQRSRGCFCSALSKMRSMPSGASGR